jgi:hypothetical protein
MQANQALLEKLVEERPQTGREPFVRFVGDTLRAAPQDQYDDMKELILDIVRQGGRRQPGGSEQPPTSWARPAQSVSAPPAGTASQQFSQFSETFSQPYRYQQQKPPHQQNWQYDSVVQQTSFPLMRQPATTTSPTPRKQLCDQQPTYPQQQQEQHQQQEQTPPSRAQPRESAESWCRLLSQDTIQADDWNGNLSTNLNVDSTMTPPADRSSLASQTSMNTPNLSVASPEIQTRLQDQSQEQ